MKTAVVFIMEAHGEEGGVKGVLITQPITRAVLITLRLMCFSYLNTFQVGPGEESERTRTHR